MFFLFMYIYIYMQFLMKNSLTFCHLSVPDLHPPCSCPHIIPGVLHKFLNFSDFDVALFATVSVTSVLLHWYFTILSFNFYTACSTKLKAGILVSPFPSALLSVCPSIRLFVCPSVCLWTELCLLCIFYNTCWIHFIFTHLIKQFQKVCRMLSVFRN